jgi:hypothetical protein
MRIQDHQSVLRKLAPVGGHQTQQDCLKAVDVLKRREATRQPKDPERPLTVVYTCLPDTIDPREKETAK